MKDTKKKDNFKTIVISSITFFGIIVFVLLVCVMCGRRGNNKPVDISTTINVNDYIKEDEHLTINAKDCTLYVDSIITLQCYSNPPEYAKEVSWSSSDNSVLTVAFDGTVTAISEGIAAVTVTHGVMTDSIIIKVISEEATVDEEFPVFDPAETEPIPTVPEASNPVVVNPTTSGQVTNPTTAGNVEVPTTMAPNVTEPVTEPSQGEITEPATQAPTTAPSTGETESVDAKETILTNLPHNGFSVYLTDTYVFEEDGNYLGQVIVTENFTQIYVMTRTTNFDGCLKSFLSTVLPTGYLRAFNNLTTAKSDMTFYVDGYKVRAVASPNGGHSQLIIYYN